MAKADVLQLVSDLSDNLADQTVSGKFYDDVVFELGLSPNESLVGAAFVAVTGGAAQYSYPATAIRLLAVHYDTVAMQPSDTKEAEAWDRQWRTSRGSPRVWLLEQESRRTFTTIPVATKDGATIGVLTPFSAAFPEGNVTAIYTENRTDVHPWEELIVALIVLKREFERDSDHRDNDFAKACYTVAQTLSAMISERF